MLDVERIRRDEFAWMNEGSTIYLNAASTGPMPARAVAAECEYTTRRAKPHLISFEDQFGTLDRCRASIAALIGAHVDEIALCTNTSAGINLAAWGLPLGPGDEVIVPDGEFPANMYPWLAAAKARGFSVVVVPARDGLLDEDALLVALDRPRVRVLSLSWVGFATGFTADLDRIGEACRARGVRFVVDAIQGLGALTIDLSRTPVDVLACGGQKWLLSPWGTGFTFVRRELLGEVEPQPVSWMAVRESDDFSRLLDYDLTWRESARRFEQVTLAYQDFAGMAASLDLLRECGAPAISAHIRAAAVRLCDGARELEIPVVTPRERGAGIASVRPAHASAVSARLTARGVIHSLREGTIRLAPHCYTTDSEIAAALATLVS